MAAFACQLALLEALTQSTYGQRYIVVNRPAESANGIRIVELYGGPAGSFPLQVALP